MMSPKASRSHTCPLNAQNSAERLASSLPAETGDLEAVAQALQDALTVVRATLAAQAEGRQVNAEDALKPTATAFKILRAATRPRRRRLLPDVELRHDATEEAEPGSRKRPRPVPSLPSGAGGAGDAAGAGDDDDDDGTPEPRRPRKRTKLQQDMRFEKDQSVIIGLRSELMMQTHVVGGLGQLAYFNVFADAKGRPFKPTAGPKALAERMQTMTVGQMATEHGSDTLVVDAITGVMQLSIVQQADTVAAVDTGARTESE